MATRFQVQCITKRPSHFDPHERIQGIGGVHDGKRWWLAEDAAILGTENGTYRFYVVANAREVDVVVATHNGRKYLKTTADSYAPNNLLNLPECPV